MPGRAGLRMLLWISAAGLAGAGWFGWLVYRDYDWSSVRSASSHSMAAAKRHTDNYQSESQAVDIDDNDLLGQTNTRWDGVHDLTGLYDTVQEEAINTDNQQTYHNASESDTVLFGQTAHPAEQAQPDAARRSAAHEDFVVVDPSLPAQPETQGLDFDTHPTAEPHMAREDFVVVKSAQSEIGVSPFLNTTDEDFVVVAESEQENESAELPEVDLADYVDSWTPIVPKIAALISHELWPQLRSYLESLPQFGDTNLERVVNAVAEDARISAVNTDGVGEGHAEGFAFYASLFDEMAHESELAEV